MTATPGSADEPSPGPTPLQRVGRGEARAVGEVIDRHGGLVWSIARRAFPVASDAEDFAQDVFIAVWKDASRFDPRLGSETTFVATIARRRLIDRQRRAHARPSPRPLPDDLAAPPPDPPAIDRAEEVERAAGALAALRDEQRLVLTLSLRDGLTYREISRVTKTPLGTVKTHARRGLIALRDALIGPREPGG